MTMKLYATASLRIRDQFYFVEQIPPNGDGPPTGGVNEVRGQGSGGQVVYALEDSPPGLVVALIDPALTHHVHLVSLGIIPAEQLRSWELFVPAGQPNFVGEPYIFQGSNADGLMMGLSPSRHEPIFLRHGDLVQPVE
jgi:hypothetical protein